MQRAIATVSLSGNLEDKLSAAVAAGFDGVELFENDLINAPMSPTEVRRRTEELGLHIFLYQPLRDFEAVPHDQFLRNVRRAELKFDVMGQLGANLMLVCSNVGEDTLDDDQLAACQLRELAERAAKRGMRIAYEALAWGRWVNDYMHAWKIVDLANHPALGTCLDSFHILSRSAEPASIREIPGEKIFYAQLADAPWLSMDVLQWSRHYRCFPGQGAFDLPQFLSHLLAAGYTGPLSLEVFNDIFREAEPERMAVDGMRSLLLLEEQADVSPSENQTRMPAQRPLTGVAFIGLEVDPASLPATRDLFRALGLERVSEEPRSLTEVWRRKAITIQLEVGPISTQGPRIAKIGIELDDPAESAKRADALLAPCADSTARAGDTVLATTAPDGLELAFCSHDRHPWNHDSARVDEHTSGESDVADLSGIDHVALAQPLDHFDEAVLFYRSVLGLAPLRAVEVAAPDGLVRSRAMIDAAGRVRIVLNAPVIGVGRRTGAPDAQHIAFSSGDVLLAAVTFRARGVPILSIPDNYYDDLDSRLDLPHDFLETIRDLDVLYDRTTSGELLHFYVGMVGERVFFEVVERRGDYSGFGAINSPVRMAAQRLNHDN